MHDQNGTQCIHSRKGETRPKKMTSALVHSQAEMGPSGLGREGFAPMGSATPGMFGASFADIGDNNITFRANAPVVQSYIVLPLRDKGDEFSKHEILFLRRSQLFQYESTQTYCGLTLSSLNAYLRHAPKDQYQKVYDVNQVWRFTGVIDNVKPLANRNAARAMAGQLDVNCVLSSKAMTFNYWQDSEQKFIPSRARRMVTCRTKGMYLWLVLKWVQSDPAYSTIHWGDAEPSSKRPRPAMDDVDEDMPDVKYNGAGAMGVPETRVLQIDQDEQSERQRRQGNLDLTLQYLQSKRGREQAPLQARHWQFVPMATPSADPPKLWEVYEDDEINQYQLDETDYDCIMVGRSHFIFGANERVPGITQRALYPFRSEDAPQHFASLNQLDVLVR